MVKLLFVCLGNICRSPSAEAVMKAIVVERGISHIEIDSAGTYGGHAGEPADARMMSHASKRGYDLTSRSRQVRDSDFSEFDYIVGMDDSNIRALKKLGKEYHHKIYKMTDFCSTSLAKEVPDPYYGGSQGFEKVLDILEDASLGLLDKILND